MDWMDNWMSTGQTSENANKHTVILIQSLPHLVNSVTLSSLQTATRGCTCHPDMLPLSLSSVRCVMYVCNCCFLRHAGRRFRRGTVEL
jgi:hypothetical protein